MSLQSQLEKVSDTTGITARFRDSRETRSAHPYLHPRVSGHIAVPIGERTPYRPNNELPVHLFVLKWRNAGFLRLATPGSKQEDKAPMDGAESDRIHQPRRKLEETEEPPADRDAPGHVPTLRAARPARTGA